MTGNSLETLHGLRIQEVFDQNKDENPPGYW